MEDDYCFETRATIVAAEKNVIAFDQTCFHPGGGGQPPDIGYVFVRDAYESKIVSAHADDEDVIWHVTESPVPIDITGEAATLTVDKERRLAVMRYHTALHVLNTIALRDYGGWITGVQIAPEYSRIDFKIDGFSSALSSELEAKVNVVLRESHALRSYNISEHEFRRREDLLRTLEAKPPVSHGRVRVVEIDGFDAQACGGTHVHNTSEVGSMSIFRTENKGKINKRLYVRLAMR